MPTYTEAQRLLRRRQITDAARRVFLQKSYTTATMADIVKETGLTEKAVAAHFETKEDVMREVAGILLAERAEAIEKASLRRPVVPPDDLLRELVAAMGLRSLAPLRVHSWSVFLSDPELVGVIAEYAARQQALLAAYAQAWLEHVGLPPEEALLRADALAASRCVDAVRWVDFAADPERLAGRAPSKEG